MKVSNLLIIMLFISISMLHGEEFQEYTQAQKDYKNKQPVQNTQNTQKQVYEQLEGNYGSIKDLNMPLGAIQKAWETSNGKETIRNVPYMENVYKLNIREGMTTLIRIPNLIKTVIIGDKSILNYEILKNEGNTLAIKPSNSGADTNVTVLDTLGKTYVFYVRTEGFNSKNLPTLIFNISNATNSIVNVIENNENAVYKIQDKDNKNGNQNESNINTPKPQTIKLNFNFGMRVKINDYDTKRIIPNNVFTDGAYTYLDYTELEFTPNSLPRVEVVRSSIDQPVNYTVIDKFIVVHSLGNFALKNGASVVCVDYTYEKVSWWRPSTWGNNGRIKEYAIKGVDTKDITENDYFQGVIDAYKNSK